MRVAEILVFKNERYWILEIPLVIVGVIVAGVTVEVHTNYSDSVGFDWLIDVDNFLSNFVRAKVQIISWPVIVIFVIVVPSPIEINVNV